MKNQTKAYIYTFLTVMCWSTVASAFKISLKYLTPIQLLLFSSVTSCLVLFIILVTQQKFKLLKTYTRSDFLHSAIAGFINPFAYYIILFKAYSLIPAQIAQPVNCSWAIVLVLLSVPLLKQKISSHSIFAILISFCGVIIVSSKGNFHSFQTTNIFGVVLAFTSSILWALYWILNMKDKRDEVAKLFLNFLFGSIYIIVIGLLTSNINLPDFKGLTGAVYVGIFEMGITFYFWLKALQLSETTAKISNYIYFMPFISLFFIHIFIGEKILFSSVMGLVFITSGVILQEYFAQKNK